MRSCTGASADSRFPRPRGCAATWSRSHTRRSRPPRSSGRVSSGRMPWRGCLTRISPAHGSHELTMTARRLGIPSSTTFDYEWAWLQHQLGCRAATRVVVPAMIPTERLARYGARPPKLLQYEGLKEEYYLSDFEPDRSVLDAWPLDPEKL